MGKIGKILSIALLAVIAYGAFLSSDKVFADPFNYEIRVNEETFPDEAFRNAILSQYYGKDGILTSDEIAKVTELSVMQRDISDLTGIGYFTSLEKLYCGDNKLTSLDLSNNTALKTLDCFKNKLTYLNISCCPNLIELYCERNCLSTLDISNNTKLMELHCFENKLTELDTVNNESLWYLWCYDNNLKSLDLSGNPGLIELICSDNELTSLDLNGNRSLEQLSCQCNNLTSLDVSRNKKIKILECFSNPFVKLYIAKDPAKFSHTYFGVDQEPVVLTESDWKYTVDWNINNSSPMKTTATAVFQCTKKGEEGYVVSERMNVMFSFSEPDCETPGIKEYIAKLPASDSRTMTAITEKNTTKIPATGHSWGEWKTTAKASIGKDGVETRICAKDNSHKQTRKIPALTPTPAPTSKPVATPTLAASDKIRLDKTEDTIVCGKTDTLKVSVKNGKPRISWQSSDTKVAEVDANGKITAKMAGAAVITASSGKDRAQCRVTVLYKDVTDPKDFWYIPTNVLTAKGVVKGYDKQTMFKPANNCTRAQMVTFIWRLMGEPSPKSKTCKFTDVKKTDYFYKACIWGNENKIVEGYKDGTFGPKIVCARRHAVTFLWRLAGQPDPNTTRNKFSDVRQKDYFYKATLWASEKKILAGYSDGTFRPNGECLRRQMVTFLYKYDKIINGY